MFEGPLDAMDAAEAFAEAAACRRVAERAEARLLQVAAHVADLHPVVDGRAAGIELPGLERLVPLAGEGAPAVAEFAPAELGAAVGMTTPAACALMGEALELRHRLPRSWARVCVGEASAWRARLLARQTMSLSKQAADYVDAQVAHLAATMTSYRARRVVEAAIKRFDPERAAREAQAAAEARGVRVRPGHDDGVVHVDLDVDAADAQVFDAVVAEIAGLLASDGDDDPLQVRRARAVGVLADPLQVLELRAAATAAADPAGSGSVRGGVGSPRRVSGRGAGAGSIVLHVHLSQAALATGEGVARAEGLGALTAQAVARWLGRRDFAVRPVVRTGTTTAADCYEVPDALREAMLAGQPYCVFPWCNRESRGCDLDHTEPYLRPDAGGPPGQTSVLNLGPLCRRHHRLKTHGRWQVEQPEAGVYLWTSPHGARYRVDHRGTTLERAA